MPSPQSPSNTLAFLFDLDGTLVDSVYQHVLAWRDALEDAGLPLAVLRIHRRIGISGGLFVSALARETGRILNYDEIQRIQQLHIDAFRRYSPQVRPLPGARELLAYLAEAAVPHAIATSGYQESVAPAMKTLQVGPNVCMCYWKLAPNILHWKCLSSSCNGTSVLLTIRSLYGLDEFDQAAFGMNRLTVALEAAVTAMRMGHPFLVTL